MSEWPEIIRGAIARALDGVHTSIPAKVKSYTAAIQQCSVEPVIEGMPPLEDVPVLWPRGGGHFVHLPLTAGDWVMLVFCEQDFSPWRLSGQALAPALLRRHGLFAYAIPGAAPDVSPMVSPATLTGAAIGVDGGMLVQITAAGVQVGGITAAIPVTNDTLLQAQLAALYAVFSGWTPVPNDGGAALKTAITALGAWPGATASSVLKVTS